MTYLVAYMISMSDITLLMYMYMSTLMVTAIRNNIRVTEIGQAELVKNSGGFAKNREQGKTLH